LEEDPMREDAVQLEETRMQGIESIADYPSFHERHRVFPAVFEQRKHARILDIAAGVGCVAQRIRDNYPAELVCNDISPTCLRILEQLEIPTVSFNIDDDELIFPFPAGHFDAIIALATIEHVIHIDHFVKEVHRMLSDDGCFYLSAPNYAGLYYLVPFLISGRTFHDPLSQPSRYEFYAHVRYFTYRSLLEFTSFFGFVPDTVYLALPEGSSRYQSVYASSKVKAILYRYVIKSIYTLFSPRWAAEPIICLRKSRNVTGRRLRKVVL
jgi:2-polyprenyl-3-methyl-5-hydroxy-6-metoxy-1,4-benzoquinol methylase